MDAPTGIMRPVQQKDKTFNDLLRMFGPTATTKAATLEEQLQSLDAQELQLVLSTAQMVKLAHGFTRNNTEPYSSLVATMYPRMNARLRRIIAEMLEEADPVPTAAPKPSQPKSADVQEALLSSYEAILSQQPTDTRAAQSKEQDNPALQAYYQIIKEQEEAASASTKTGDDDFLARLTQSESSGNSQAEITIKDGRKFVGKLQFGAARLGDFKSATGKRFTQTEFKANEALQDEVAAWHFKDIDKAIDALGDAAKGYDRDGLRSVAHLGGKSGMRRFVKSGGKHNPADELGTSLKDYYDKFSNGGGA